MRSLSRFFHQQWVMWGGWTLVLFGYGLLSMMTIGYLNWDGHWFLQVSARMAAGEVLFREIFFGVTPLSIYPLAVVVGALGPHYLILCAYQSLVYAASGLFAFMIMKELGLGRGAVAGRGCAAKFGAAGNLVSLGDRK